MDPKSLPTLDPKLKEAYERVMATSLPSTPNAATPKAPEPQLNHSHDQTPTPPPVPPLAAPAPVAAPQNTAPQVSAPKPISTGSSTFTAGGNSSVHTEKGFKLSPMLLIVAGGVFFVVYTIFWLRFFSVSLPFLP